MSSSRSGRRLLRVASHLVIALGATQALAQAETGTLTVRETKGRPCSLIVEGLEAGALPWTGELAPGAYTVWIACEGDNSAPATAQITAGQATELNLAPQPPKLAQASASRRCSADRDCPPEDSCVSGTCRKRDDDMISEETLAALGEACGDRSCRDGLLCVEHKCVDKTSAPFGYRGALSADWQVAFGAGGDAKYPAPMHALMPNLEAPLGPKARYHLSLGYMNLNGNGGLRFSPAGFGFPLPVKNPWGLELLVEPGVDLLTLGAPSLLGNADVYLSSTLWARVVLRRGNLMFTATPIRLEFIHMRGIGDYGSWGTVFNETGRNFAVGLGAGVLL